jgi:uncharacterized surface protein with fasciclin (FAS1) repeats
MQFALNGTPSTERPVQRVTTRSVNHNETRRTNMKDQISNLTLAAVMALGVAMGVMTARAAADKNIIDTAIAAGQFNTLATALSAAGLVDTLKGPGPFTVFAPTDEAFAKLPPGTLESLLKKENKDQLTAILTYHVVPGEVMAADVANLKEAKTVNGRTVRVNRSNGKIMINNATVTRADVPASNGVIHIIDSVMLPPSS